ncbi:hypothetical protein H0A64_09865 [Alcaligenaceae bacterium]|nr:hypothetical protein [Alcaligenaceae bacterium]
MVDLDDCVVDGDIAPWADEVVAALDSYTEFSPSGQGLRIVVQGSVPFDWTNHDVGIEVYAGHQNRFLTITGDHLLGSPATVARPAAEVLADLASRYARERKTAEIIDLAMPDLLDELTLPDPAALPISDAARAFLEYGAAGDDRSGTLHATGVALYAAGLDDAVVFSTLVCNEHAMEVALDHRRQDSDRAMLYLWREHCVKARPKARALVASPDEFDVIAAPRGEVKLPPFVRDNKGAILATIDNVTMAVRQMSVCGLDVRFDAFRDEIVFALPGTNGWQPFTDADYVRMRITLERGGFKPIGRELIRDVVLLVAYDNTFDTAIDWLGGLAWDGVPRVDSFLTTYFGAEDSPYTRAVSQYMWSALAGRVMAPGCKADMAPILVGKQGTGKSSAVEAIAPDSEYFTEISFSEKDEDLSRRMRGRLVAELGELRGLHTREQEAIKAFITKTHENWIPKYREFAVQFPRRLVFIGTTNKDEFLADETGNRRWLPVRVNQVNVAGIREDRLQLWAEARDIFTRSGIQFRDAETLATDAHEEHMIHDSWQDAVSTWLDEPDLLTGESPRERDFLRVADVLVEALRFDQRNITRRDETRMGAVFSALGYSRKRLRVDGQRAYVYARD